MSREYRVGKDPAPRKPARKEEQHPRYDRRSSSDAQKRDELRHALRHRDMDAFEDYDDY